MKTKEELTGSKNDVETLSVKLAELSEYELDQVAGGILPPGGDHLPEDDAGGDFPNNRPGIQPYIEFGDDWD